MRVFLQTYDTETDTWDTVWSGPVEFFYEANKDAPDICEQVRQWATSDDRDRVAALNLGVSGTYRLWEAM